MSKAAPPCDTPGNQPQAVAPSAMRRATDWGTQKLIPPWKVAAAAQIEQWAPTTPITEAAFDEGMDAVESHSAGRAPGAGAAAQKGSARE